MRIYWKCIYILVAVYLTMDTNVYGQMQQLEIDGAIVIGQTLENSPTSGTIRWTGSDFEGFNGNQWLSMTSGSTANANGASNTITDIDGNIYSIATIGTQTWMQENLKTSRYRDGSPIPQLVIDASWSADQTGAWCWYQNNPRVESPYGKLYNWHAVVNTNGLCPTGWHVPTSAEWTVLVDYLGGTATAGGKMKEMGLANWLSPNSGASNKSGMAALPIGYRFQGGSYSSHGVNASFWSSTASSTNTFAWYLVLEHDNMTSVLYDFQNGSGFSVRCLKN